MPGKLPTDVYVVIEADPFLSKAQEFKRDWIATHTIWSEFAKQQGADQMWSHQRLYGLYFPRGKIPEGWTKPDGRGCSKPKAKSLILAKVVALPSKPSNFTFYGDAIIDTLRYEGGPGREGNSGMGCIGGFAEPWIGWCGDVFLGRIPHAANAAANHLYLHPGDIIDPEIVNWVVPAGLRVISRAEFELIYAQHEVDKERAQTAA